MNSVLELTYKDADGFTQCDSYVVEGLFTQEEILEMQSIMGRIDSEACFVIAHELGLPTPSEKMADEDDGCFPSSQDHVFTMVDLFRDHTPTPTHFQTDEPATDAGVSTGVLLARFRQAQWDIAAEMARLGMEY